MSHVDGLACVAYVSCARPARYRARSHPRASHGVRLCVVSVLCGRVSGDTRRGTPWERGRLPARAGANLLGSVT